MGQPWIEGWDITYIQMARGFVTLAAVVDVVSRCVLSHRVSTMMEADFCVEALEEALAKPGKPEVFNTARASQLTSEAFTGVPTKNAIAISHRIAKRDPFGSLWTARGPHSWQGLARQCVPRVKPEDRAARA